MSVAEPVTRAQEPRARAPPPAGAAGWPAALAALFAAALVLRLVGMRTGLPFVYNADENSHFVPRAIGMFGHGFNPGYFVNPPAFTYVLHAVFALRWGTDPAVIGGAFAADPTPVVHARPGRVGDARRDRGRADGDRGRAAVRRPPRRRCWRPRCWPSPSCPSSTATSRSTTRRRSAPLAAALSGSPASSAPAARANTCWPASPSASRSPTKYTAGIVIVAVVAAALLARWRTPARRNLASGGRGSCAPASLAAEPVRAARPRARSATALRKQTETAGERRAASSGSRTAAGWRLLPGDGTWGFGWLPSLAALGGAAGLLARDRRLGLRARRRRPLLLLLYLGRTVALLRPLDAAGLPDPVPARGRGPASPPRRAGAPPAAARRRSLGAAVAAAAARPGRSCSASTTTSCWRAPTRARWRASGWWRTSRRAPRSSSSRSLPTSGRPTSGARCSRPPAAATAGTSGARRARASPTTAR